MLEYKDGLELEIYISDLLSKQNPNSCEDLEVLSVQLHDHVENAIQDYIIDCDLDLADYDSPY